MVARPALVLFVSLMLGCSSSKHATSPSHAGTPKCRDGAGDDVKMAGRTAGSAAKTGVNAAVDGVVQAGSATAGLVEGGKGEAKEKWKTGGQETKANARKNAAETKSEASTPNCQ